MTKGPAGELMRLTGYLPRVGWLRNLLVPLVCILLAGAVTFIVDLCFLRPKATSWPAPEKSKLLEGVAPDFCLPTATGERQVRLADFRGQKPVVLLFGSFGCDILCADLKLVQKIERAYGKAAQFLFIYVSEGPHPEAFPPLPGGTPETRLERVRRGLRHFDVTMPCLLDGSNCVVETAYDAHPRRLLAVDRDGRIGLDLGKGLIRSPWNLDALDRWLRVNTR
jgi:hypothetical protein